MNKQSNDASSKMHRQTCTHAESAESTELANKNNSHEQPPTNNGRNCVRYSGCMKTNEDDLTKQ